MLTALVLLVLTAPRATDVMMRARGLAIGGGWGVFLAAVAGFSGLGVLHSGLTGLPTTIRDDVHAATHVKTVRKLESAEQAPRMFRNYASEVKIAALVRPRLAGTRTGLFVLGDDPMLYVLLHEDPPWTFTAYNTSPISDQHRVVDWLRSKRPKVVVFDETTSTFDGIPSVVRIPLVYQAVIRMYQPVEHAGDYEVLALRTRGTAVASSFWATQLGATVDLGYVPDATPVPARAQTTPGPGLSPFLVVRRTAVSTGPAQVAVPVRFGGSTFVVRFEASANRTSVRIPLARIWAWALSQHPTLAPGTTSGWQSSIDYAPLSPNQLY